MQTPNIVGVKELRTNLNQYIDLVRKGATLTVVKRSKAVFKIVPVVEEDEQWEQVVDFTTIKKGGVSILNLLDRL